MRSTITIIAMLFALAATERSEAEETAPVESRDAVLLLDTGPLHLRFHITWKGKALTTARQQYLERLRAALDRNQDGKVTRKETHSSPLFNARRQFQDNPFLASLDEKHTLSLRDIQRQVDRIAGEAVVYRQDRSAAENDLQVFKLLDADESGRIEPKEMITAAARVAALDTDRDQCINFEEFLPAPMPPTQPVAIQPQTTDDDRPKPTIASLIRDMREPLLARRLIRKYDKNRDDRLSADELGWSKSRVKELDESRDGALSSRELRKLPSSAVDLELAVELSAEELSENSPALRVVSSAADRQAPAPRPDLVRLVFGGTQVTFSFRDVDPVQSAVSNAMRTFNEIDFDANGYIDRTEIVDRFRFERYLFTAMDTDNDDKIFAEEMEAYVSARAEPAASSCQVNVYDTGQGFFQMLDASGDGRISIRELRSMHKHLAAQTKSGKDLVPSDNGRHYHIEFVRGSYQLFGRSERMVFQETKFIQRPAVGPIWFQRMDRNSDGDLTWNEFLGPPEVFHALDADRDGLVDYKEAERGDDL